MTGTWAADLVIVASHAAILAAIATVLRRRRDLSRRTRRLGVLMSLTLLLGMVLAEVGGEPISDQLAENLWAPMGAQDSATWNLDREGGMEKAFCCINATAMDFARVGQMVLDDGEANGQQIISKEWIDRISTPAKNSVLDWGYSAQWWHLPGNDQDFSAIGIYGQYIYVNPEDDTTIVKLSDYGTEQDELETVNMMRAIAADLNNQS